MPKTIHASTWIKIIIILFLNGNNVILEKEFTAFTVRNKTGTRSAFNRQLTNRAVHKQAFTDKELLVIYKTGVLILTGNKPASLVNNQFRSIPAVRTSILFRSAKTIGLFCEVLKKKGVHFKLSQMVETPASRIVYRKNIDRNNLKCTRKKLSICLKIILK